MVSLESSLLNSSISMSWSKPVGRLIKRGLDRYISTDFDQDIDMDESNKLLSKDTDRRYEVDLSQLS